MKMKRILFAAFAALFALTTMAQEWVSMDELVVKMPMGKQPYYYRDSNGYFKQLETDCTFRFFMQHIPITKIRLSKQKVKDQYVFSEKPNGVVQGYWLVDNKKKTVQVGKDKEVVVKLDKTQPVDGLWYEYDFGRDVYLRSISLSDTEFRGIEILLSADAKRQASLTRNDVTNKYKPLILDMIKVYSNDPDRYHQEVGEGTLPAIKAEAAYGKFMKDLLYNGTSVFAKPQPLSTTMDALLEHALTIADIKREDGIVAYVKEGIQNLGSGTELNLMTFKRLAAEYENLKEEAARQEFMAKAEHALRKAMTQNNVVFNGRTINDLYIDGDRLWFRRGRNTPPKGIMQKFNGQWYFASEVDNITSVKKTSSSTTRIEYTDGDYIVVNYRDYDSTYDIPEARLHRRQMNGRNGIFSLTRESGIAKVKFEFDNGDVFRNGGIYFEDASENNFTNELSDVFLKNCDFTGPVTGVLGKTLNMYEGEYVYANSTTERVSAGNLPPTLRRNQEEAGARQQAELRKPFIGKLVGKWKVTKLYCDSYNKCANGMGFAMTYQFFADGRYTAWLTYTAPAIASGRTVKFSVNGVWIVKDGNNIELDTKETYQNVSFTYSGNNYWERKKVAELNQNPSLRNLAIAGVVQDLGVLGREHIFRDNKLSSIQFSGNTLNCNYYGENWNSCTMTKIK